MEQIRIKSDFLKKFSIKGEDTKFKEGWLAKLPHRFILDKRLDVYDRLVGIYIKMRIYRGHTESFPSIATIANDLGISERKVKNSTNMLEKMDYIVIEKKWGIRNKYKVKF